MSLNEYGNNANQEIDLPPAMPNMILLQQIINKYSKTNGIGNKYGAFIIAKDVSATFGIKRQETASACKMQPINPGVFGSLCRFLKTKNQKI